MFWQLLGRYCSYQLPFYPGKMAELSQREVVTILMGHPVSSCSYLPTPPVPMMTRVFLLKGFMSVTSS